MLFMRLLQSHQLYLTKVVGGKNVHGESSLTRLMFV